MSTGVATYFSEAPTDASAIASTPFVDVSQVQVLNGPQGTLFGRSSAAGAVLITPAHPDLDRFGGSLSATVGDYGRVQGTAVLNLPVVAGQLGLRIAANTTHVDGYTRVIGTSRHLDGVNNQQVRVGLELKKGAFDNYIVGSYLNVNQSATSYVLTAVNPNPPSLGGLYLLPSILGPATGPVVFGGVCTQAVALGFAANQANCESQRAAALAAIAPAFAAELARVSTGDSAARSVPASYNGTPQFAKVRRYGIVDVATYDFGNLGPIELRAKNIFSFDSYTSNVVGNAVDGIGGRVLYSAGFATGAQRGVVGGNNYVGSSLVVPKGPSIDTYTNDFQVQIKAEDGLLTGVAGVYYSDQDIPADLSGVSTLYSVFSGVFLPDQGNIAGTGFSTGGRVRETAVYTQWTLDLSQSIHGLGITGGYRHSSNRQRYNTRAAAPNYSLPGFVPGTPATLVPGAASSTKTSSSGYNYTIQITEQINPDWMVYGSVNRAYVPGGVNLLGQTAATLPNYSPTYDPETVLNLELGTKANFNLGGMRGKLGVALYQNNFTNIIQPLTGILNGAAVQYSANIAAARLRGAEFYGTIIPSSNWEFRFSYNYNQARYTKWIGSDPASVAQPGDPLCVAASPTGLCYLDLTENPFPYMPKHQGHLTVVYHAPVPDGWGKLSFSATAYGQTRSYFVTSAHRDLQAFVSGGGDRKMGRDAVSQSPYATLNLRADLLNAGDSGVDVSLFVNNVTDTLYAAGKSEVLNTIGLATTNYAPPRMFGVELSTKF